MRILLAGGQGYIGSHLYSQLEEQASVTSIDSGNGTTEKDFINLDLTNIDNVNEFGNNCDHFDALIFLVGLAHTKGKGADLPKYESVNYKTLVNLLTVFQNQKKLPRQIIFSSSISAYGERYNTSIYKENLEPEPFSSYAVTKLLAERYLLENFFDRSWILRFAPVYSPDFLLNINRRTKIRGVFYKIGGGRKKLSLCNVENIKTVIEKIIDGSIPAGIYNLSDPIEYTYNNLLSYQKVERVVRIPSLFVQILYYLGKIFNHTFLKENCIKLISDNVFPSNKICSYVSLPALLNGLKYSNDK